MSLKANIVSRKLFSSMGLCFSPGSLDKDTKVAHFVTASSAPESDRLETGPDGMVKSMYQEFPQEYIVGQG